MEAPTFHPPEGKASDLSKNQPANISLLCWLCVDTKEPPDATEKTVAAPKVPALTLDVRGLLTAGLGSL